MSKVNELPFLCLHNMRSDSVSTD